MNPVSLFYAALIIGAPAVLFGLLAIIFDMGILDFPGYVYITFGAATVAAVGMLGVVFAGYYSLFILYAVYLALYIPFLWGAVVWISKDVEAYARQARVPVRPWETALHEERQGRLETAARLYAEYCGEECEDCDALRHYAGCLVKMERFADAAGIYRRIFDITKGPIQIDAGLEIAYICEVRMGDHEAAEAQIRAMRRYYEGTDLAEKFEIEARRLKVRIAGDPRPFEERIDLA